VSGDAGEVRPPSALDRARQVDAWCDRFETDWKGGGKPRIEDYQGAAPGPLHADLIPELVALEVALRRAAGESPDLDDYRRRFPGPDGWLDATLGGGEPPAGPALPTPDLPTTVAGAQGPGGTPGRDRGAPGDPTVRELAALARKLLERPGRESVAPPVARATPGPRPGRRFRIVRPHARGGLGEVFLARDEQLRREVALKEILPQHADRPGSRARFVREAEITGSLEHPGIVPIYALEQDEDGRPYYVMRFILGETLQEAVDRFHAPDRGSHAPRERMLELRGLLRRFIDVCNAVSYAHSRGVIHRDLKPANVMLGPFGETLVVDWGLAKPWTVAAEALTAVGGGADEWPEPSDEAVTETSTGMTLGTPRYMSPEQAGGHPDRVGPASDIYGLGATLYHLLTGSAPFADPNLAAVLDMARRGEFPPPRRVNPDVPPALESICLKAMARAPEDRYPSARALAEDVERWLADEPVSAHRDGVVARLARRARRHRTAAAGAAALLVTGMVALAIGTALIGRESAHREVQRRLAVRNFSMARGAVDRMLSHVGEVELAEVPQMEPVRRQLLGEALQFYEGFTHQRGDDPDLRVEMGRALIRLARVQDLLGDSTAAERTYRRAVATLVPLAARGDLARARDGLGMLLKRANRFREAESELRAALTLGEALARESPADPEARRALAAGRYHLATVLARTRGRAPEDEQTYRAAVQIQQDLVSGARDRPELRADLARSLNNLGLLLADDGRVAEAQAAFREAAALLKAPAGARPGAAGHRWQRARVLSNLGVLLLGAKDLSGAEAALRQAHTLLDALAEAFPSVLDYRRDRASVLNNLGLLHAALGRHEDAEAAYVAALRLQEEIVATSTAIIPDDRQRLATTRLNLGMMRLGSDTAAAEAGFREAVGVHERLLELHPDVPEYRATLGTALAALARAQWGRGDLGGARRSLEQAIAQHRSALASPRDRDGLTQLRTDYGSLALLLREAGDHDGIARAIERLPELFPDRGDEYLRAAVFLVRCAEMAARDPSLTAARRAELARSYTDRAIGWLRRASDRGLLADPAELDRPEFEPLRGREDFERLRPVPRPASTFG
jgi:eukaryotic-like serine/threonine-protein kinase